MKRLKKYFKAISFFLACIIQTQGCTVYKKQTITLEEAASTNDKVKLVTKANETQKYLYITNVNREFYGIKKINNDLTKILLQQENLYSIRPIDKGGSHIATVLIGLGIMGLVVVGIAGLSLSGGIGMSN